jgi:uncharacterized membrane protein YphA (DoxX/SURF4 family)
MLTPIFLIQLFIAFGIYNVWLLRLNQPTKWRGGDASNMEEEFRVYGLSTSMMRVVRVLKLLAATCLVAGLWDPPLALVGAVGMAALMLAAVAMHLKVGDPLRKSIPAASLFLLSLIVVAVHVAS